MHLTFCRWIAGAGDTEGRERGGDGGQQSIQSNPSRRDSGDRSCLENVLNLLLGKAVFVVVTREDISDVLLN